MELRNLVDIIRRIVRQETIWQRIYKGKVVNNIDPRKTGRVLVVIYDLGFDTPEKGFWCSATDKNSLSVPDINSWVRVFFENGDRNQAKYFGQALEMEDQIPENFKSLPSSHVLFEDPNNKIHINFDGILNRMEIGNSGHESAAREGDEVISDNTIDSSFWAWLSGFLSVFKTWAPVPADGGAALKTALTAFFGANPDPTQLISEINEGSEQILIGDK